MAGLRDFVAQNFRPIIVTFFNRLETLVARGSGVDIYDAGIFGNFFSTVIYMSIASFLCALPFVLLYKIINIITERI